MTSCSLLPIVLLWKFNPCLCDCWSISIPCPSCRGLGELGGEESPTQLGRLATFATSRTQPQSSLNKPTQPPFAVLADRDRPLFYYRYCTNIVDEATMATLNWRTINIDALDPDSPANFDLNSLTPAVAPISTADVQSLAGQIRQLLRGGDNEGALRGALENPPYGADDRGKVRSIRCPSSSTLHSNPLQWNAIGCFSESGPREKVAAGLLGWNSQ